MNETFEIQRMTKAVANLVTVLVEITTVKAREQVAVSTPSPPQSRLVSDPVNTLMTKRDVAAYLKVSMRTVDSLMRKGGLPHIKFGKRCVRFTLGSLEDHVNRNSRRY